MPRPTSALLRQQNERSQARPVNQPLPFHGGPMPTEALVASAAAFNGNTERIYRGQSSWQAEAWRFYDTVPELRFAAGWIGNALSRCLLSPAEVEEDGSKVKTKDAAISAALQEMMTGKDGQAQMLEQLGIHLTVAGEGYLVGRRVNVVLPNGQSGKSDVPVWEVVGVNELSVAGGVWVVDYGSQMQDRVQLDPNDTVIRIWRPHPARRIEADSPIRTMVMGGALAEIEALTQRIFGQTQSQNAGAGVWAIPNNIEFAGMDPTKNKAEQMQELLWTNMQGAVMDPSAPSAFVPTIIAADSEAVKNFTDPIHFWSPYDEKVNEGRKEAVLRFAIGTTAHSASATPATS